MFCSDNDLNFAKVPRRRFPGKHKSRRDESPGWRRQCCFFGGSFACESRCPSI